MELRAHLEQTPDGSLTLWSSAPTPPEQQAAEAKSTGGTFALSLGLGAVLATLTWNWLAYDLECSRAQLGCTAHHLLYEETFPTQSLGSAQVSPRRHKNGTYHAVVVPGLPGDALYTSSDSGRARAVANAFNSFRAGGSGTFSATSPGPLGWSLLALLFPLSLAATLTHPRHRGKEREADRHPRLRLTPHHLAFTRTQEEHAAREARSYRVPRTHRWPLADVAFFDTQNDSELGKTFLQAVSREPCVENVYRGESAEVARLCEDFNRHLALLQQRKGLG